jgi:hypothetical protein
MDDYSGYQAQNGDVDENMSSKTHYLGITYDDKIALLRDYTTTEFARRKEARWYLAKQCIGVCQSQVGSPRSFCNSYSLSQEVQKHSALETETSVLLSRSRHDRRVYKHTEFLKVVQ